MKFEINSRRGSSFGIWDGATPLEALVAMHTEAGYECSVGEDNVDFERPSDEALAGGLENWHIVQISAELAVDIAIEESIEQDAHIMLEHDEQIVEVLRERTGLSGLCFTGDVETSGDPATWSIGVEEPQDPVEELRGIRVAIAELAAELEAKAEELGATTKSSPAEQTVALLMATCRRHVARKLRAALSK